MSPPRLPDPALSHPTRRGQHVRPTHQGGATHACWLRLACRTDHLTWHCQCTGNTEPTNQLCMLGACRLSGGCTLGEMELGNGRNFLSARTQAAWYILANKTLMAMKAGQAAPWGSTGYGRDPTSSCNESQVLLLKNPEYRQSSPDPELSASSGEENGQIGPTS